MGQTDANKRGWRLCGVEPRRQIAIGVALRQGGGQYGKAQRIEADWLRGKQQMDVLRDGGQSLGTAPHAFAQGRIVVARDHQPGAAEARQGVEEATHGSVRNRLGIEHVTGNQDRIDLMLGGQRRQAFNRRDPCLGQQRGVLGIEGGVETSDLPVCCVEKFGHECYFFDNIVANLRHGYCLYAAYAFVV
jgi:hypothetical protein